MLKIPCESAVCCSKLHVQSDVSNLRRGLEFPTIGMTFEWPLEREEECQVYTRALRYHTAVVLGLLFSLTAASPPHLRTRAPCLFARGCPRGLRCLLATSQIRPEKLTGFAAFAWQTFASVIVTRLVALILQVATLQPAEHTAAQMTNSAMMHCNRGDVSLTYVRQTERQPGTHSERQMRAEAAAASPEGSQTGCDTVIHRWRHERQANQTPALSAAQTSFGVASLFIVH